MKPREILATLLALAAVITAVFALAEQRVRRERQERPQIQVDWDRVVDAEEEKLTLTWLGISRFPQAREGTWIERRLEERFNVEFKPLFLDNNAYVRRKPLMLAGGTVPDVIWDNDPVVVQRDAYHGFLLELPYKVILKYAPHYVESLNANAPDAWLYSYWQGENWGLPTHGIRNLYPPPSLWRLDWLRNVGIAEVPETLEQMYEALWRFRHRDPDGDGVQDTYGMSPNSQAWWALFSEVFGAFGVLPFDWMEKDGQVVWGGIQRECKETLDLLRRWYAEGLIDPDFLASQTGSNSPTEQKFVSGITGYLAGRGRFESFDLGNKASIAHTIGELQPQAELAPGRFPVGPGGRRGARVWGPGGHIVAFGAHLARKPEKVVRVLRMLEAIAEDEAFFLEMRMGQRRVHWDFDAERGLHVLPPYDARDGDKKQLINLTLNLATGYFSPCGAAPDLVDRYLPQPLIEHRRRYQRPEWALMDVFGKPDVVPSAGRYLRDLRQMQLTVFAEIIKGDRELAYFDTFVEQWLAQGGAHMLEEARQLYAAKWEIFDRVGVR